MREGAADAVVLARAGLERLGLDAPHTVIPPDVMLTAAGQGALAVAARENSPLRETVREALNHSPTERAVRAERNLLRNLEGGCRVPVGALAVARDEDIRLRAVVASPDGALVYRGDAMGSVPDEVGQRLARDLLEQGAEVVLGEVREVRR
jgi:hydroxymethylbilane synthase